MHFGSLAAKIHRKFSCRKSCKQLVAISGKENFFLPQLIEKWGGTGREAGEKAQKNFFNQSVIIANS